MSAQELENEIKELIKTLKIYENDIKKVSGSDKL